MEIIGIFSAFVWGGFSMWAFMYGWKHRIFKW